MAPAPIPSDEAEYSALVASFEDASVPFETWRHHRTHLIVALWFARALPEAEAVARVRAGILGILAANGIQSTPTSGYHETITRVWVALLADYLAGAAPAPLPERVAGALDALSDQELLLRFYTRERLLSPEARAGWVEPDLAALRLRACP